ncbi:membrane protein [Klebsiella pneumoniae]|uniref:Probable membrane transporter protein n=1 Tax=Klebsiella pneumoniae TaxID=573 RepID=A0A447RHB0_KLEPN|nr:membrane protein [Klebsiella pneumoniae]
MFDLHTISFLLIFIAAGLVKGVTGMGLPTVAMGLLGLLMPPQAAAALLVLPSLLTNLWQLLAGPALAQIVRRLWLMMTGIIIGTLAGSSLLIGLNPRWSALALGAALIVYAGYALCSPVFQVSGRVEKWLSPLMGGLTGVITGATGVFVIPAVPWLQALGFRRDELVQALGVVVHPFHPGVGGWPRPATMAGMMMHGYCRRWRCCRHCSACGWDSGSAHVSARSAFVRAFCCSCWRWG